MTLRSLASKRILLTGGAGFHGRAVVEALRRRGCSDLFSGPGDTFDAATPHVIPAPIRKCVEAREDVRHRIEVGGTGKATQELPCVEDAAEAVCLATERYDEPDRVNVGTGVEITIQELVERIAATVGFRGQIDRDLSRPDGQPRRCLDTSRAERAFGFRARTSLAEGLERTVHWCLDRRRVDAPRQ